jgi:hypothetical protein
VLHLRHLAYYATQSGPLAIQLFSYLQPLHSL